MCYYNNQELTHYGVIGMKWGIRRYQNKDGTLTKAGKIRYNADVEKAKTDLSDAKSAYDLAVKDYISLITAAGGLSYNKAAIKKLNETFKNVKYAKKVLADAKTKAKIETQTKKSKRQLRYEQGYKEQGMTQGETELEPKRL